MFRAKHRPSSGAQNCTSSLWFCIRERLLDFVVPGRWLRQAIWSSQDIKQADKFCWTQDIHLCGALAPDSFLAMADTFTHHWRYNTPIILLTNIVAVLINTPLHRLAAVNVPWEVSSG
jgi:hypothetical protein